MKEVIIFGSSGSVGKSTLEVIGSGSRDFRVKGLCVHRDTAALKEQIDKYKPRYVCVRDESAAGRIEPLVKGKTRFFKGAKGLEEFSTLTSDISVMAIAGISALKPLLLNMPRTKRIALANKESIVTAAPIIFQEAKLHNTEIIPVDSEINAFFQLMTSSPGGAGEDFRKVYLTASGGALFGYKKEGLKRVRPARVLKHPTWNMGRRITVDSATLVNKAFEVIETHYFFGIPYEKISVVLHKESFVHALVECHDNTLLACMYSPDMKTPLRHALYYPQRRPLDKDVNFLKPFACSFSPLILKNYPLLGLLLAAAKRNDNSLVILNACDEILIEAFLEKRIRFVDIFTIMRYLFKRYESGPIRNIEDVFFWDLWARVKTRERIEKI